jgi:hypothetical protein
MNLGKKQLISVGFVLLMITFLVPACGKKAPPLPPVKDGNVLVAPENLTYSFEKNEVILTWDHSVDPVNAKIAPEAFRVYMGTKDLNGCQGCPFVFESVGVVSMPEMVYRRALEPRIHYYFRVQAIGKEGIKSPYSKTCSIDVEP